MKKRILLLTALVLCVAIFSIRASAEDVYQKVQAKTNYVNVLIENNEVNAPDFVIEGRTYLGLRAISEALGYEVSWNGEEKLVILETSDNKNFGETKIEKGKSEEYSELNVLNDYVNAIIINGEPYKVSNFVHEGTTYLGLRDMGNLLGYRVSWDEKTKTASLSKGLKDVKLIGENTEKDALATVYYKVYATNMPELTEEEILKEITDTVALLEFFEDAAEKNNVKYQMPDMEKEYQEYVNSYGSAENHLAELMNYNISVEEDKLFFEETAKLNVLQPVVVDYLYKNLDTIKDLKVKARIDYDESIDEITKKIATVKHILIPTVDLESGIKLSETELKNAKNLANDVRSKAIKSVNAFDELLKVYNNDPGQTDAGYQVYQNSGFVKEFEDAALKLEKGEISQVVESVYGYHIIKCLDTKTYTPEFEDYFEEAYLNSINTLLDAEFAKFKGEKNIIFTIK